MALLEIKGLLKQYGELKAIDNVDLEIEKGEICGLLGPNGAGKTTLLRIINSLLVSDAGSVTINGIPASIKACRNIGYMPEERGLYEKMRIDEQILYFGQLKGGDPARLRVVMGEYIDIFNLKGQEKRKVKELSKGNQQKVQIIATLVHEPDLVILDEPFSGFDPINSALLQNLIAHLHEKGTTIILSSHNMPAIEEMCNSIALINHGKLLVKGDIDSIKEQHKSDEFILMTRNPLSIPLLKDSGLVSDISEGSPLRGRKGNVYNIKKLSGVKNIDILDAVAMQGEILHFEERLPSLNDIFLNLTIGRDAGRTLSLHPGETEEFPRETQQVENNKN